jgi:16S rRNA (guanine527-N7)-methyltransferase
LLREGLERLWEMWGEVGGLSDVGSVAGTLERYMDEIELFNPAYKLVGVKDREELVVRHILDSLSGLKVISRCLAGQGAGACAEGAAIADVGSGAGLPGIPLAVCLPGCSFTLIERMGRRVGFLRNVQAVLNLANVRVEEAEMEQSAPFRFKVVTFRAFRPLEINIVKSLCRLLAPDGVLVAYKGRKEVLEKEIAAGLDVDLTAEVVPVHVPFLGEERHIVVIHPHR